MSGAVVALGLGLSGAALAVVLAKRAKKKSAKAKPTGELAPTGHREPIKTAVWTPQKPEDIQNLLRTACTCVDLGSRLEDDQLALCVWRAYWPGIEYPERSVDGDHPSVQQALDAVWASIQSARAGLCQNLPDYPLDTDSDDEPQQGAVPPIWPGPRPEPTTPIDMAALSRTVPTPGYFYQVRSADRFLGDGGIVATALFHGVMAAARAKKIALDKAEAMADALASDPKAQLAYLSVIQCSPWNDEMYGTWGYGPEDIPAPHGRAIRLIARHDRVRERLAAGQMPIRTLDPGTPADKGTGSATGAGDMLELLWMPPLRSDALLDTNRARQVVAEGLVWPDGSSKLNPPPSVQALGIANPAAGPWGCEGAAA